MGALLGLINMRQSVITKEIEVIKKDENIDASIREVLIELNKSGYSTIGSCSGYRWEHKPAKRGCNFGPFVSIRAYIWEARNLLMKLNDLLYGTGWMVEHPIGAQTQYDSDGKIISITFHPTVTWEEEYDLSSTTVFIEYDKNKSDKKILKAWNVLLRKLNYK